MKILIRHKGAPPIHLCFPTRMLVNRPLARLLIQQIERETKTNLGAIGAQDLDRLIDEVLRLKKKYPHLDLVDVASWDGDIVQINL
ncbi:hypothetical protein [Harryflintia acetispora]|uniref:hypothetical protein n=1 Tax=Harryflintia acetispora TaxID=1849041 RepID=UPI001899FCB7|nr:hypothetical protein [Harryflintia acetispora]